MDYRIIILKIVKENQPLGIHKFDMLFYNKVDFSVPWAPIVEELKSEGMLQAGYGYFITEKGEKYLNDNSSEANLPTGWLDAK